MSAKCQTQKPIRLFGMFNFRSVDTGRADLVQLVYCAVLITEPYIYIEVYIEVYLQIVIAVA